jgi:hypothetical protein
VDIDPNATLLGRRSRGLLLLSSRRVRVPARHLKRSRQGVFARGLIVRPFGLGMQSRGVIRSPRQMIDNLRPRP